MEGMTKKTTILFPPRLYQQLQRAARRQKRSVGALVRDAVELQFGEGGLAARLRSIDALSRLEAPLAKPEQIEREIERGALDG